MGGQSGPNLENKECAVREKGGCSRAHQQAGEGDATVEEVLAQRAVPLCSRHNAPSVSRKRGARAGRALVASGGLERQEEGV